LGYSTGNDCGAICPGCYWLGRRLWITGTRSGGLAWPAGRPIFPPHPRYPGESPCALRRNFSTSCARGFRFRKSWAAREIEKAEREWKGLSPFNKEKTPSFTVSDDKGFYHDFSSGKHGNIFDLLMETEGVSFPEAVERLAEMAGVPLPAYSPEAEAREERRKTPHDIVELAATFFQSTLASRNGARGRGYLADRSLRSAMPAVRLHRGR
jgi:CHC2 zinc finger